MAKVTTGALNVNSVADVPVKLFVMETEATAEDDTELEVKQTIDVIAIHEVVLHIALATMAVAVRSTPAKFTPRIVKLVAPAAMMFGTLEYVTTGASSVNDIAIVPVK